MAAQFGLTTGETFEDLKKFLLFYYDAFGKRDESAFLRCLTQDCMMMRYKFSGSGGNYHHGTTPAALKKVFSLEGFGGVEIQSISNVDGLVYVVGRHRSNPVTWGYFSECLSLRCENNRILIEKSIFVPTRDHDFNGTRWVQLRGRASFIPSLAELPAETSSDDEDMDHED